MPAASPAPVLLVCGEDDFNVKQRARQAFQKWSEELGGMDHEVIDAQVSNGGEALKSLAKLREALNTLPFFGGGKVVWLQNCSFLGDDRTAGSQAVTETLADLAADLKTFQWQNVRLLISAGKVDKRKTFYKTIEKIGEVETFAALSADDKDWASKAEDHALKQLKTLKKTIGDEALSELVSNVGPNLRQLSNEVEKLALYVGDRAQIGAEDVDAIVTRNKQARAFALGDALGDRDLPRLLRCLDEEMWAMQFDKDKSEIGLLYGLISKVRAMLFLREMMREKWIQPDGDYNRFKAQLERIPREKLPEDKRFNPLAMNPYILFKALPHARRYATEELVRAMELLLQCNQRLISSALDEKLVLQQTLLEIARKSQPSTARVS
ncbi:MAG TPA: DNA polymerase III subunit delta [Methylomirabilota bacterium]|nr:DNA polymerase III subunit delta [Methylomirabilota bacterium]